MRLGLHVLQCPTGVYTFVGNVPVELGHKIPATTSDVMGGRAFRDGEIIYTWKFPLFNTEQEARDFAASRGFSIYKPAR